MPTQMIIPVSYTHLLPLGLANMVSNLVMGGMGLPDILGGFAVGILTALCCYLMRRKGWNPLLVAILVILIPGPVS